MPSSLSLPFRPGRGEVFGSSFLGRRACQLRVPRILCLPFFFSSLHVSGEFFLPPVEVGVRRCLSTATTATAFLFFFFSWTCAVRGIFFLFFQAAQGLAVLFSLLCVERMIWSLLPSQDLERRRTSFCTFFFLGYSLALELPSFLRIEKEIEALPARIR